MKYAMNRKDKNVGINTISPKKLRIPWKSEPTIYHTIIAEPITTAPIEKNTNATRGIPSVQSAVPNNPRKPVLSSNDEIKNTTNNTNNASITNGTPSKKTAPKILKMVVIIMTMINIMVPTVMLAPPKTFATDRNATRFGKKFHAISSGQVTIDTGKTPTVSIILYIGSKYQLNGKRFQKICTRGVLL